MAYEPYALAFPAASFSLFSDDFADGGELPQVCYATGGDQSPQLGWGPVPEGTESLVLTAYDPDAPIPGGLWHWIVTDIPGSQRGLARNAGQLGAGFLPAGATARANDLGRPAYSGVNPPPNTGTHRLVVCVTALSVPALELPPAASPALLNIVMIEHTLGRALLTGTSRPA